MAVDPFRGLANWQWPQLKPENIGLVYGILVVSVWGILIPWIGRKKGWWK